jgi:hypothetical protein
MITGKRAVRNLSIGLLKVAEIMLHFGTEI